MRRWLGLLGLVWGMLTPVLSGAVSDQLIEMGTPITFTDAGSGDVALTTANRSTGTGRISARYDLGAGDHPFLYELRCAFQGGAAVTVGTTIEIYVSTADSAQSDGGVGTADADIVSDKRNNLKLALVLIADTTSANTPIAASAMVHLFQRYVSVGYWSNLGTTTRNTAGSSYCKLTPFNIEAQ